MANHSSILAWEIPWTEECSVHGYSPWGRKESDMTEHTQPPPYLHTTSIGPLSGFPAHNDQKLSKGCQGVQKYPQRTDEKQDGEKYNLLQEYLSHISSFWILHTSTQRVLLHHHKTQGAGHLEPSRKGEMVFRAIFKSEGSSSFIRPDSKTPGQSHLPSCVQDGHRALGPARIPERDPAWNPARGTPGSCSPSTDGNPLANHGLERPL